VPDRQHLRVHRSGARGIGQHHPRDGEIERRRALPLADRHRLSDSAATGRDPPGAAEVDGILGTSELSRIVDLVRQAAGRHDWATAAPPGYLYDATTPRLMTARVPYAYVKIAEGCDMGCTSARSRSSAASIAAGRWPTS